MDTTTPQGEFLFHIFGALAQFERSLIQERVQAGLAAAARRGRRGGRPVTHGLSAEQRKGLDALVQRREDTGQNWLTWLRQMPQAAKPSAKSA